MDDFQVFDKIGKYEYWYINYMILIVDGAYSNVFKVKRKEDDSIYALKKVKLQNLTAKEKDNAINEVRILASIKHPNVIQYKDAFIDESSKSLW